MLVNINGCMALSIYATTPGKTKHIGIRQRFIRELVKSKTYRHKVVSYSGDARGRPHQVHFTHYIVPQAHQKDVNKSGTYSRPTHV